MTADTPRPGARAALRVGAFRYLMLAGAGLQLGGWIQRVALSWLVYELTGSAAQLGGVAFVSSIFVLFISPFTGPLADHVGAGRALMLSALTQAAGALVIAFAVFADQASLPLIYAVAVSYGAGQAINQPMRNLLVYDAVGRDLLKAALALNSLTGNVMRVVGPSLGGVIVGTLGTEFAFVAQAVLVLAAVVGVALLRVRVTSRAGAAASLWLELGGAFRHALENRPVRTSIIVALLASTFVYPYMQFMPVFVDNLGRGATGLGIMSSAIGVGSLLGSMYVATGRGGQRTMLWAGFAYMALLVAFTQVPSFWAAFGVLCVAGVAHSLFSTLNQALLQLNAGEEYRARVLGLYTWTGGIEPFTVLGLGVLAEALGASAAVGGSIALATVVTFALALDVTRRARVAVPGQAPSSEAARG